MAWWCRRQSDQAWRTTGDRAGSGKAPHLTGKRWRSTSTQFFKAVVATAGDVDRPGHGSASDSRGPGITVRAEPRILTRWLRPYTNTTPIAAITSPATV